MSSGRYIHVRRPALEQFTPGTWVIHEDVDPDDEHDYYVGAVVAPTPTDLLHGAETMGSDTEHCVLVEWPTDLGRQWEYPEDLSIITEEG